MKRIKLLLPILTTALLILPGLNAEAAEKLQLASGTKKTTATITLKDLQSLEGEFSAKSSTQGATVKINSVEATSDGGAMCMTSGNKIFMVSSGEPVTTTIQVNLEFSKDGTFVLTLDGGMTDKDGNYEDYSSDAKKCVEEMTITVGTSNGTSTNTGNQKPSSSNKDDKDSKEEEKDDEVDYEALEKALNDVAEAINSNEDLKTLQELLTKANEGTVLLDSEDQEAVDEAAVEIQESLEDLGFDVELNLDAEEEEEPEGFEVEVKENDGSALENVLKIAKIVLPILAILIFIAAAIYFWRKAKNKAPNYDGAPMVDYDIEDDDE